MPLEEYRAKRDFERTSEPAGRARPTKGSLSFVVQKHAARALHYDFRLELDGVLVSWAVPKGPSLDPAEKHLAVHVEDHPLEYGGFEGTIPAGEYGAGSVIVWDRGTWQPLGDPHAGIEKGDLKFELFGEKLHGMWVLVRLKPRPNEKRENWLLIKERDEFARPHKDYDVLAENPLSAISGVGVDEIGGRRSESAQSSDPDGASAPAPVPPATPIAPFPASVDLELATLVDRPPEGDDWLAEVKYDGYRVVIALDAGQARAFTRSHADWSERFAPLTRAAEALPATSTILDGEVVVFDAAGVSRFELLQKALGEHPERVAFAAFDLLFLNGHDLRDLPLIKRKELLGELLRDLPATSPLRFADHVGGPIADFYRQACASDLEGIVCKRANSRYVAGRGREWLKVKCRLSQEVVVGGFTEGSGVRAPLGSVLVGTYDGDRLVYAGGIGSGFSEASVREMRARLEALEQPAPPFDPPPRITGHVVHWTRPEIVIQAEFREWTADGMLRQGVFLGVREDKPAREVVRERPAIDPPSGPRSRETSPSGSAVLGIHITNAGKTLFPDSPAFTKLDLARYYEAIAPLMLAEAAERPLTLVRCPSGEGADCFYQRHPDAGLPSHIRRLKHTLGGERVELLYIDSAEGLVALAQMGVGEIHTWMSKIDLPTRPDRICFDLDPGPDVAWAQICSAAKVVRDECTGLGFSAFLKSTGSKGLHVVIPVEPVWEFARVRALAKNVVDRLVKRHPEALVGKAAKDVRGGRVFFDYLRNAEGASAVAPYSTRVRPGPPCAVPLEWDELDDRLDIRAFTPDRVLARVREGVDPWRDIAKASARIGVLRSAEASLGE